MTYTHYGEIGDVWKHLPLAEILSIESPTAYWESHAASGIYEIAPEPNQEYGVLQYLEKAVTSDVLRRSPYTTTLDSYRDDDDDEEKLRRYPGSPVIAMHILSNSQSTTSEEPSFIFCDIDRKAVQSIQNQVRKFRIQEASIKTVHGDGISALTEALSTTPSDKLDQTFVHIDPYTPMSKGENGLSSWDLFQRLLEEGVKAMLWYGYQTEDEAIKKDEYFEEKLGSSEFNGDAHNLWIGEVIVDAFTDSKTNAIHPGIFGCGVICGNIRNQAIKRCREVGEELAAAYSNATLPDGNDGKLSFVEPSS
jgi:23S rRNA (adenine2030-N6)-methyltransferase